MSPPASTGAPGAAAFRVSFAALVAFFTLLPVPLIPEMFLTDPGTGWHLATGRWMLEHRELPGTDLFSFTAPGTPWLPYEWAFQLCAALCERAGGLGLLRCASAVLLLVTVLVTYRRTLDLGANVLVALAAAVSLVLTLQLHALARPHLFTYAFFAIANAWLADTATRRRETLPQLCLLPLLTTAWANLHPGFMALFVLLGCYVTSTAIEWWRFRDPRSLTALRRLVWTSLACGLASLVNPFGWGLHWHVVEFLRIDVLQYWEEFKSPDFHSSSAALTIFRLILVSVPLLLSQSRSRLNRHEGLLLAVFLFFALSSVRHIMLFAIVAIPPFARILSDLMRVHLPALTRALAPVTAAQAGIRSAPLQVVVLAGACLAPVLLVPRLGPDTLIGPNLSPGAALAIRAQPLAFTRPLNESTSGGTLIHEFWPGLRVYMDDRTDVYGSEFVKRSYLRLILLRPGWREIIARWKPDSAILTTGSPLAAALTGETNAWRVVHRDATNMLLIRLSPPGS